MYSFIKIRVDYSWSRDFVCGMRQGCRRGNCKKGRTRLDKSKTCQETQYDLGGRTDLRRAGRSCWIKTWREPIRFGRAREQVSTNEKREKTWYNPDGRAGLGKWKMRVDLIRSGQKIREAGGLQKSDLLKREWRKEKLKEMIRKSWLRIMRKRYYTKIGWDQPWKICKTDSRIQT